MVPHRQAKVLAQPCSLSLFWGVPRGWGAVLGRDLCLWVPEGWGDVAPMMEPLGSVPSS